jgi:hypothetical protein
MDNKLNYQQARTVRKQSLKDVIADELIRGKGFGSAITGAIGLKTQARMKGFKEKFDPLNIVKFLTFGSRLGPALYGKLFGRSRKDIEYFAGRAKQIGRKGQKLTKDKDDEVDENTGGMKKVLKQILTFLKRSHESDMTLREEENNLKESNKLHDEKRHKELLKALGARTEPTATPVEKTKEEDNGFLNGLMDSIRNIFKGITDKISSIMSHISDLLAFKKLFGVLDILKLVRWATSPVGLIILGLTAIWEFERYIRGVTQDAMDKAIQEAIEKGDTKTALKQIENRETNRIQRTTNPSGGMDVIIPQESVNAGDVYRETKSRMMEQAEKGNPLAEKAMDQMQNEEGKRRNEYIKVHEIDNNTATPRQLEEIEKYVEMEIPLSGPIKEYVPGKPLIERKSVKKLLDNIKNWAKDDSPKTSEDKFYENAIKEIPNNIKNWSHSPETSEDKFYENAIKEIPNNFWNWYNSPENVSTEDDKIYKKMFEVIQENPTGPWNFDKEIPGYNQWNRTAKPVDAKTSQLDMQQQEYSDLMNKLASSKYNKNNSTSTSKSVNTSGVKVASSSSIPMPSGRLLHESFRDAIIDSFV